MILTTSSSPAWSAGPDFAVGRRCALWVAVLTCLAALFAVCASAQAAVPSLYVANSFGFSHPARLAGYAAGAAGNAAPLTNVVGAAPRLNGPIGVARDPQGLVWVANSFTPVSLTAYAATATGNSAPVASIAGAATGLTQPAGVAFDPSARLVVANTRGSITEYAPGARGNVTPAVTISGPDTGLSNPNGVAFDAAGDLFVTNEGNNSVTEYAPGASGDAFPTATLQGSATGLNAPAAIVFDATGRMYVANLADGITGTVTEYAPGAHNNAAPVATIAGSATKLTEPDAVGIDDAGNLFVGDFHNLVAVFAPGATGKVAPQRVITGAATALDGVSGLLVVDAPTATTLPAPGLSQTTAALAATVVPHGTPTSYHFEYGATTAYGSATATVNAGAGPGPRAAFASIAGLSAGTTYHYRVVATSASGTVLGSDASFTTVGPTSTPMRYVSSIPAFGTGANSSDPPSILGFPPGARGNLAPTVTIAGPQTMLTSPTGVAVDAAGDVFAADLFGDQVLEYAPGAHGNVAPIARIPVPSEQGPVALALRSAGQLLVSDFNGGAVFEYAKDAAGAWGLLHTISGSATGLSAPVGVAFGPGGTIVVANDVLNGSVREFAPGADGNVAPIRTLAGAATFLGEPFGVAVDSAGEVWVADNGHGSVFVFAANASGNTAPVRFISGASGLTSPDALALDGAGDVLVTDGQGLTEDFAAGVSGKGVAPFATLSGSETGIVSPIGIAISPSLLGIATATLPAATVGTAYNQTVSASGGAKPYRFSLASGVLPAGLTLNGATGAITGTPTAAATASFTVKATDASQPTAQFALQTLSIVVRPPVVPSVLVANGGSGTVTDYPLSPTGNVAPLFTLGHGNRLSGPSGVAVDSTGRVYVVNSGGNTVSEFAPGVTSAAGPDVTIAGSNTGLSNPTGIALDAAGRIYVTSQSSATVSVFAAGADGNAAPIATISGTNTGLSGPASATVNSAGDLWVANASNNSLTEYAPGANGNVAPIATVTGAATDLNSPVGIGQDEHGNLLVANLYGESIARFAPTATGDAAPIGLITGGNTTLDFPHGVDVDAQGRIYVPNQFGNSIAVFAPDATGSVVPVATIAGATTGLSAPQAVAVVPPLSILTKHLPGAIVRHLYDVTLRAALGTTPYRWSLAHGRLPAGVRLSRDGLLSGVPRRPGRQWVTIAVTDAGHPRMSARRRFLLTVRCPTIGRHRTCAINHVTRRQTPPFLPRRRLNAGR
jgi:sugar lactone lactonase YvrE